MNKKVLATAMVVLGLFPSLLFAQLYRMEVDAQESGSQKVIDRVFTGNTVGLQVSFYDGGDPLPVTNWTMRFMYGYGQYDTNGMVPVVGTAGASNNVVVFDSATNVFFSENGSYYFSIVGTNTDGKVRTFARGRMIEEYDPATGGSYSNGIPMPWANLNFASKEWIVEYISTNEFETVVSYGTNSTTAYRGDWGASVSNLAASAVQDGDSIAALTVMSLMANGDLTELGRDVKGRDAGSVGTFGAAFGSGTTAGDYGAAFGDYTAAGDYGAAFGYGAAAAFGGAAFGSGTAAGDYGAAFGVQNRGGSNSFIFSDHDDDVYFDRTNFPSTFNARVKGGVHFLIGTNWLTATNDAQTNLVLSVPGTVSAGSFAFSDGDAITNWPRGDVLGATINPPHTVATNDGILAFTIGATGSGFPLTNDVSADGFDIKSIDAIVGNSLMLTNDASVRDLTVRRNVQVLGNAEYAGDFTVSGNLTLIGSATNLNWVVIDNRTNVYGGTNYYETTVYRTQVVYQTTIVYTNVVTTNQVNTYVNENGTWVATNAEHVLLPHLRDYRDRNAEAIGTWDFADATVSNLYLPPDAIQTASIAALADGVATIDLGSNWCWRLDASGDITAINFSTAGLKEGAMNSNSVKGILLEVSRGSTANWAWGGHLSHITNTAPPADAVSHLLLIGPSQDVTGTNGWAVY